MIIENLNKYSGSKVTSILLLLHKIEDEVDFEHPVEVCLKFDNEELLTIQCARNGQSIDITSEHPKEIKMEELGDYVIAELPTDSNLNNLVGSRLVKISEVYSEYCKSVIGLFFETSRSKSSILNLGDELFIFSDIPPEVISEEKLIIRNSK
jgi:hypothetical protein